MGWSLVTKVACGRLSDPAGRYPHGTHPENGMTAYENRLTTSWHHHVFLRSAKPSQGLRVDQFSARSVREAF
jgi:hypothetical protein